MPGKKILSNRDGISTFFDHFKVVLFVASYYLTQQRQYKQDKKNDGEAILLEDFFHVRDLKVMLCGEILVFKFSYQRINNKQINTSTHQRINIYYSEST